MTISPGDWVYVHSPRTRPQIEAMSLIRNERVRVIFVEEEDGESFVLVSYSARNNRRLRLALRLEQVTPAVAKLT